MGLPIWRNPEEEVAKKTASDARTAAARSPIRRRPSVHGRRATRPRLARDSSHRAANDTPPPNLRSFTSDRPRGEWRRSANRGVPPVSTLLESAATRSSLPPLPPAVPESRRAELQHLDARQRELRSDIAQLNHMQERASRMIREVRSREPDHAAPLPDDWAEWNRTERQAWLEDRRRPQWTRSPSPFSLLAADSTPARLRDAARHHRLRETSPRVPPSDALDLADGPLPRQPALPTPPHDTVEDAESLFIPDQLRDRPTDPRRRLHPLRRSWGPDSPIDGLGDRNRSPTSVDGWEIMRSTIAPDATLPSADSSFTSAAVSRSFSSGGTIITEPERAPEDGDQSDSASSAFPDDLPCSDEEREATAAFALDVYFSDLGSSDGNERIERHLAARNREGNRFALPGEPEWVEVGFRLIQEALLTPEGRARVSRLSQERPGLGPALRNTERWISEFEQRAIAPRRHGSQRPRTAHITDGEPSSPHPERYSSDARATVGHTRDQFTNLFATRSTADALADASPRASSQPPRYEELSANAATSFDAPEAYPVSPPSSRSRRGVADSLLGGDEQDLDGVRRIVEGLAQREDIPDEWWTSVGLARHLTESRSRVRSRSPAGRTPLTSTAAVRSLIRNERQGRSPRL